MARFSPFEKIDFRRPFSRKPFILVSVVMLAGLGIILGRLVELTVINGADNRRRADENRILIRPLRAPRGVILDRHGQALTRNIPIKRLVDIPGDDEKEILIDDVGRFYSLGKASAHVVGFVGEISQEELIDCQATSDCSLKPGDILGKTGLERQYDLILRGRDGAELVEVDANGKLIRRIGAESPQTGQDLKTFLDAGLQKIMAQVLGDRRGAAVAIDPADGSILGLVSSPAFDPNMFQKSQLKSENLPFLNRAIAGEYPPGSIFKLVTAVAGLETGKVTPATSIMDTGEIRIGSFRFGNWYFDQYGKTEGSLDLVRAITRSNDVFFYRVGELVGPEKLAEWAKKLGLGTKTGIDLSPEAEGLIPDPVWKEKTFQERWFLGNTYHMAIGQGDVRVTPLQAGVMTAAAVTGKRCQPRVAISDFPAKRDPALQERFQNSEFCSQTEVSDENRNLILEGMVGSCSSGGVAFPFFEWNESGKPAAVACKTGTAQHGGKQAKPHAWITIAAPIAKDEGRRTKDEGKYILNLSSEKRIVLTVMLEEAGEGSYEAAPAAKEILTTWFSQEK